MDSLASMSLLVDRTHAVVIECGSSVLWCGTLFHRKVSVVLLRNRVGYLVYPDKVVCLSRNRATSMALDKMLVDVI